MVPAGEKNLGPRVIAIIQFWTDTIGGGGKKWFL